MDPERQSVDSERFLDALNRLARDPQRVAIDLGKMDLWMVLSTIQLACRHPQFNGPTRQIVERIARKLGDSLCANDQDLRMLFAAGWNKEFDEEREPI